MQSKAQNMENHPFFGVGTSDFIPKNPTKYLTDGTYNCLIRDVKQNISTKPKTLGEVSVIIEVIVMEVVVDKGEFTTPEGNTLKSNDPGDVIEIHIKMSWRKTAIRLLTAFIAAAAEIGPQEAAEIDEASWLEFAEKCCYHFGDQNEYFDTTDWQEQPLKGKGVQIAGETILTKESRRDFTQVKFYPWPRDEDNN